MVINPQEAGAYFTHLWVGGCQRYRKSFRISHNPFYSQVNDKECKKTRYETCYHHFDAKICPKLSTASMVGLQYRTSFLIEMVVTDLLSWFFFFFFFFLL